MDSARKCLGFAGMLGRSESFFRHLAASFSGDEGVDAKENRGKLLSEQEYLDSHGVDELLEEIRCMLLDARPKDPKAFIAQYYGQSQGGLEKLPPKDLFSYWSPKAMMAGDESHRDSVPSPPPETLEEDKQVNSIIEELNQYRHPSVVDDPQSPIKLLQSILRARNTGSTKKRARLAVGLDIGGTLSKITFWEPLEEEFVSHYEKEIEFLTQSLTYGSTGVRDIDLGFQWHKGRFHFLNFETRKVENAIEMLRENGLLMREPVLLATGGGAQKYAQLFKQTLGCELIKGDELACLLLGLNFLLAVVPDEVFYLEDPENPSTSRKLIYEIPPDGVYPYILVNIGSGVSIIIVKDERTFKRVSGTSIGGGTFLGLCKLIANCQSFEEAMELAEKGDRNKVDMLVGDIYGGDYTAFDLKADTVASSFGKCIGLDTLDKDSAKPFGREDIASSLLSMIGINIAQLAYLCAMRHKVSRICFAGNFLRRNALSMKALSFSIKYWSKGQMQALFLKHEGYFGSLGAFLLQEQTLIEMFNDDNDSVQ